MYAQLVHFLNTEQYIAPMLDQIVNARPLYHYNAITVDIRPPHHTLDHDNENIHINFINSLLSSNDPNSIQKGIFCTVYWAFINRNHGNAIQRSNEVNQNLPNNFQNIINDIKRHIVQEDYSQALQITIQLNGIGYSTGTKIVTFLNPNNCGVLDSVIANKVNLENLNFDGNNNLFTGIGMANGYITNSNNNIELYQRYCSWLSITSHFVNKQLRVNNWRAIDIERALYAIALDANNQLLMAA